MRWVKWLLFIIVSVSLILFVYNTDFTLVVKLLQQIGSRFFLLLLITLLAYLAGTLGWKYCFSTSLLYLPLPYLFSIRHIGETVGFLNPTGIVGGEALKIYLLGEEGIHKAEILNSVVVSRIVMIITQIFLFTIALIIYYPTNSWFELITNTNFLTTLLFVTAFFYSFYKYYLIQKQKNFNYYKWKFLNVFIKRVINLNQTFRGYFSLNKAPLFKSFFWCLLHWLLGSLEFFFILRFLGQEVNLGQALLLDMGVIIFKSFGAFIPGQLGVEEYANKFMLETIGITDQAIWVTVSIIRRTRQFFWIVVGAIAYFLIERKRNRVKANLDGSTFR